MPKRILIYLGVITMTLCAYKCSRTQEAYLTVQACLVGENGTGKFVEIMREVASAQGLQFIDRSSTTEKSLDDTRGKGLVKLTSVPTLNVGIEGDHGLGVTATNLGLPSNQVALGFTAGADPAKARKLSDQLVQALSRQWRVQKVKKGKGVFPMSACGE